MKRIDIIQSLEVRSSTEKAWEIIGPGFINISNWGRGILRSWNNDNVKPSFEGAPAGGRYCELIGFGTFDEKIIHYSEREREISWSATGEKLPKFVSGLQNELKVERIDDHTCRLTSHISASLNGIMGLLMRSLMKKNFTRQIKGFLNDWKIYAETGDISEAKKREKSKYRT